MGNGKTTETKNIKDGGVLTSNPLNRGLLNSTTETKNIEDGVVFTSNQLNRVSLNSDTIWTEYTTERTKYHDFSGLYEGHEKGINILFERKKYNILVVYFPIPNIYGGSPMQKIEFVLGSEGKQSARSKNYCRAIIYKAADDEEYLTIDMNSILTSTGEIKSDITVYVHARNPTPRSLPIFTYRFVLLYNNSQEEKLGMYIHVDSITCTFTDDHTAEKIAHTKGKISHRRKDHTPKKTSHTKEKTTHQRKDHTEEKNTKKLGVS